MKVKALETDQPKTIIDIARLAGVSKSTVSRVLNNKGYVSEKSREKVLTVVESTGFMLNEAAKTLKTQKQDTIAVIIPRIESQSVSKMVQGINNALVGTNTNIVLGITNLDREKELYYLQYFSQQAVQGIIFMARTISKDHEAIIHKSQVPIIVLAQKTTITSSVSFDEVGAAKQVAQAMMNKHTTVGYVGVSTDDYAIGIERLAGVQAVAKEYGQEVVLELGGFKSQDGYEATKRLFARKPHLTAIIAATDSIAIGVITYLRERNITIGSDVAVAGFGDSQFAQLLQPQLASVYYPYVDAGEQAVKTLLAKNEQHHVLATQFITRASCE